MGRNRQSGFSFIEVLVVIAVFTLITGITFGLLDTSQQRYRMESQVLDSFQGAQIAMDQMARDIHAAGYPPPNSLVTIPENVASSPFAWMPGYPDTPCTVGACTTPGDFDLIIETDVDPQIKNGVEWVRYRLNGTTLERGWAKKAVGVGADPDTATAGNMIIYVENVMNNASSAQRAALQASYPTLFPGNAPVPIFSYTYDAGKPSQPKNIREVSITLIVQAQNLDPKTRQPRVVTLTGLARRLNPNQ